MKVVHSINTSNKSWANFFPNYFLNNRFVESSIFFCSSVKTTLELLDFPARKAWQDILWILLVTLVHSGPIEIGTYGAKCLLTNWKVFILFVYYVASLSSVALIYVFKMNGTSITKCFFNIIFDMKSFLSGLVISKSHDLVISLYRLIKLCERYDSGILWSKSGRTALRWRDRSVLEHFAKNSHHLFDPSSLLDFFTGFSLFALFTS